MKYWFTSDTHFSHANIIKYCHRPFKSAADMNQWLIDQINAVVGEKDVLYHLGDFAFGRELHDLSYIRWKIKCKNIHLILGNHDKLITKNLTHERVQGAFKVISPFGCQIKIEDQSIVLCHYSLRTWNKAHYGAWHLYGHSHGSLTDDINSLSLDVGVDTCLFGHARFTPYSYEELKQIMGQKNFKPIDHHGDRNEN